MALFSNEKHLLTSTSIVSPTSAETDLERTRLYQLDITLFSHRSTLSDLLCSLNLFRRSIRDLLHLEPELT